MPSVWLDDDEVIDLILERPYLVQTAFEKLQKKLEDEGELASKAINATGRLRAKIKELEEKLEKTVDKS